MPTLPTSVSAFVVTSLACFETPETVVSAVKVDFGLTLTRQRVECWNPERAAGARLGAKWRELFYETRRRYLVELASIPIAHRSYRLRTLERIAAQAEEMGNYALVCHVLALAAREAGSAAPPPSTERVTSVVTDRHRRTQ